MKDLKTVYGALNKIYRGGAYSSLELGEALKDAENPAFVTKAVYGVLEKNTYLDYHIGRLTGRKPQEAVETVLKLGMYCLAFMDSLPDYAVVDSVVDLCKEVGKRENAGFVNAVLKAFASSKDVLPEGEIDAISVKYSCPKWVVDEYIGTYGKEETLEIVAAPAFTLEHVVPNPATYSSDKLEAALKGAEAEYICSDAGGVWTRNTPFVRKLFNEGRITFQAYSSVVCCRAAAVAEGEKVLDACAAPGGKSVYIALHTDKARVTACDVHPHRVELIKKYAARMGANVETKLCDATQFNPEFKDAFDVVMCDAPCSGLGVAARKPDIYLTADMAGVRELKRIQAKILANCADYVRVGGRLVYSTCTLTHLENDGVADDFLKKNPDFEQQSRRLLLPDGKGTDGFFIAVFERLK